MKLKSMEITAAEQREKHEAMISPSSPGDYPSFSSRYPYGLEIRLDNEAMEKLDMDSMPAVGKKVRIEAIGVVTGAHVNEQRSMKGDRGKVEKRKSLEIQIQRLAVSPNPQSAEDAVDDALEAMD